MDCDKFESAMMDDLYGELDELTSAALKRHVGGCAACAALLEGLRATQRVAIVPLAVPAFDLEARILRAAFPAMATTHGVSRGVPAAVPQGRRSARALSVAGNWAMRPQTAMAAVFLVMIGTSGLLLRGKSSRAPASAAMTVTEEGTPAPVAASAIPQPNFAPSPVAPLSSPPVANANDAPLFGAGSTTSATALRAMGGAGGPAIGGAAGIGAVSASASEAELRRYRAGAGAAKAAPRVATSSPQSLVEVGEAPADESDRPAARGGAAKSVTGDEAASDPAANADRSSGSFARAPPPAGAAPPPAAAAPPPAAAPWQTAPASFDTALTAYKARRFDEAARTFDALSPADPAADLWTARALREGNGCAAAVQRFDEVAARAPGSSTGWDAALEGARCYRFLGNTSAARARLVPLLKVAAYSERARAELSALAHAPPASPTAPSRP